MAKTKLLLIGCGNIGSALLNIWAQHEDLAEIVVVQPSLSAQQTFVHAKFITFVKTVGDIAAAFQPDIVILAFKPQHLDEALPHYRHLLNEQTAVVSLLAGVSIARLQPHCQQCGIVRIMPNIAMKIGQSVNLIYAAAKVSSEVHNEIEQLFALTGEVVWLEKENLIDFLTPISSSGLAYFFLLADLMTQTAIKFGIEPDLAKAMVQQTLLGSARLAEQSPEADFAQMVTKVACKKGATEAGLAMFRPALTDLFDQLMEVSLERIEQLNQ
ncbi:MAG: pyrroline-5-carboxylate reductase [Gammaproteobacteria bacterium]|nr:pyrroline-5-carboxylate reductase [Gammaproteobacteria bacterium]